MKNLKYVKSKKCVAMLVAITAAFSIAVSSTVAPLKFYADGEEITGQQNPEPTSGSNENTQENSSETIEEFTNDVSNLISDTAETPAPTEPVQGEASTPETTMDSVVDAAEAVNTLGLDATKPAVDENGNAVIDENGYPVLTPDTNNEELKKLIDNPMSVVPGNTEDTGAKQDIAQANTDLNNSKSHLDTAKGIEDKAIEDTKETSKKIDTLTNEINSQLITDANRLDGTDKDSKESCIENSITSGNTNIDAVNNAVTLPEAQKALQDAIKDKDNAKTELGKLEQFIDSAEKQIENLQQEYDDAEKDYKKALDEVALAKDELNNAHTDAANAKKKLEEANKRVGALKEKVDTIAENKEELEAIQTQYYALMVYYFRTYGTAKYDGNTLNVQKSVEGLSEQKINQNAIKPNDKVLKLGRDLLKDIVIYMVKTELGADSNANVIFHGMDDDNVENNIYYGYNGAKEQEAREGVVFVNGNRQDQVVVDERDKGNSGPYKKDIDGNDAKWKDARQDLWTIANGDGGRHNRIEVSYVDENGQRQTKYYNYIFKNSDYGDYTSENKNSELSKGLVYVALVEENDDGFFNEIRLEENGYNVDNYNNVLNLLQEIANVKNYETAQKELDEALKKVEKLEKEIERLQNTSVSLDALNALRDKLATANMEVGQAQERKLMLQEKIENLEGRINNVDLSRFDEKPSNEDKPNQENNNSGDNNNGNNTENNFNNNLQNTNVATILTLNDLEFEQDGTLSKKYVEVDFTKETLRILGYKCVGHYASYNNFIYKLYKNDVEITELDIPQAYKCGDTVYVITGIGKEALKDFKFLKQVTIPDTVVRIKEGAFQNCTKLEKLILPKNIKLVEKNAFKNCAAMKSITYNNIVYENKKYFNAKLKMDKVAQDDTWVEIIPFV